ncbi:putative nuclease YhcG (plasmid) [Abditibacteriota bacterium]|nr:putative nuclease YhcG [Abditibacteriota bacterium]
MNSKAGAYKGCFPAATVILWRMSEILPAHYPQFLSILKARVASAQIRAALSVNRELVLLYWEMGRAILQEQEAHGWGAKVIDHLSADLKREFPQMQGFSPRNLKYMRRFAQEWPEEPIVQEALAQITWYHNIALLEKLSDADLRLWYARKTVENGWSRAVLALQIESGLHLRLGQAPNNFARTLPAPDSDLAAQLLKDPYNFDFLTLSESARERELEQGLLDHIRHFLLELGQGFAFLGSQYHLQIGAGTSEEEDFYLDLLFYHVRLHCYVVVDLKMEAFAPEHAGKMNFYLSVVDDLLKAPMDAPSIGLILCKTHNRLRAEYALRGMNKPVGVSAFEMTQALPANLRPSLPSIEELEAELSVDDDKIVGGQ